MDLFSDHVHDDVMETVYRDGHAGTAWTKCMEGAGNFWGCYFCYAPDIAVVGPFLDTIVELFVERCVLIIQSAMLPVYRGNVSNYIICCFFVVSRNCTRSFRSIQVSGTFVSIYDKI